MNEYKYKDISIGQEEVFSKRITVDMEIKFREITGDVNPLHQNDAFAVSLGADKFKSHVSFGLLTASLLSTLAGVYLPGKYSLIHSVDNISFKKPVYAGDTLNVRGIVKDKVDNLNLIITNVDITNQVGKTVLKAVMKIIVQK